MPDYQPNGFNIVIRNTADYGIANGVKVLVYGRAGVGKTMLTKTAPGPIVLSAESGILSLRRWNIPYIPIYSIRDLKEAQRWCFSSIEARQYATFGIDSSSEIAEQILGHEKTQTRDGRKAYGETADQMMFILRQFRDWQGPNVYFTAKQETQNVNGSLYARPMMPGQKLPDAVPYFPDEIFQLLVGKDQQGNEIHYLRTRPDQFSEAKDRSGMLAEFEPADLTLIFNKIMGR